jgi:hypothetical protein
MTHASPGCAARTSSGSMRARSRMRAVFLADLATTYVHDGEVDKGCEVAGEAAVTLSKAGYATSAERLHDFRALVRPWQDRSSVKELDERLAHT